MNKENITSSNSSIFNQLSKRYLIAISVIAAIILLSQWLIQGHLYKQINDSRVINVAGRQRMLSQKITKQSLQIRPQNTPQQNQRIKNQLEETLTLWIDSHEGLKNGNEALKLPANNSQPITSMFEEVEPHFKKITKASSVIIDLLDTPKFYSDTVQSAIQQILDHEDDFLTGMNTIVFQYDLEARNKVLNLRTIELILLFIALVALGLELIFIFRPTAFYAQKIVNQLTKAEQKAKQKSNEMAQLYEEKERSVQDLRVLNFAIDQAALFASITLSGELIYISDKLKKFLGYKNFTPAGQFADILSQDEGEQDYLTQIIKIPRSGIWIGEVPITTIDQKKCWLELSIVPVNRSGIKQDYLILCNDITVRKDTLLALEKVSQEKLDEEIRLQNIRSSQVVEAQEKERERIAKDMHDGIGQMLTALKFYLESLNPDQPEKLKQKIEGLKDLSSNLIKGVRIATFNLTPPELTDYGIATALSKLCKELSRLTGQNVLFDNKTANEQRFDSIVETNIYRITQEAVNNAIKYAEANYILVTLSKSEHMLSIKIDDDGKGFDPNDVNQSASSNNSTNMGLAFMQQRVKFIFGRLFVRSAKGQGTRITINIPVSGEVSSSIKQ